ncbi:MAG: hypothetical protein ACK40T_06320 [Akkermansiaceae bacterium]|jgi:hypothetical protein
MKYPYYLAVAFSSVILISGQAYAQFPFPNAGAHSARFSPPVILTDSGKALEAKYTSSLTALQAELEKAIPKLDEAKVALWVQAIQAEEAPEKDAAAKAALVEKMQGAEGRLRDLEDQLKYAPQTLEDAQEDLARARARGQEDPERMKVLQGAESFLKSRQGDIDKLNAAIQTVKQEVEDAKVQLPEAIKAAVTAKQAHDQALSNTWKAMDALRVSSLLSSNALDAKLAQYTILKDATPAVLAEFAQQSPENQKLLDQLLTDKDLMLQMVVNDGAAQGRYGQAMKIYTDIQRSSPKAKEGVFQRLAMAISLAHAVPIEKRDRPTGADGLEASDTGSGDNKAKFIDPVQRYLSFEKWYEAGELNVCFKGLNVWNLRRVVDCADPDEMMVWARQMMNTLRPDCVPSDDDTLKFVDVTDHEIAYGSGGLVNDLPDKHFMQNILANGGICGRRGFFTRFILQSFGVPSTERVEPGHSAVTLWHPSDWQTRLGHNWGKSNRGFYAKMGGGGGNYGADVNFLRSSQARENETAYLKVKRAQWIGSVIGESWKPGLITWSGKTTGPAPLKPGQVAPPSTWSDIALHEQRRIISQLQSTKTAPAVAKAEPKATGKASVDAKGVITIPATACSSPTESKRVLYKGRQADLVVFLNNKEGKTVLHMSRYAKAGDTFEYTFDAPKAGKYQLVADIATPMPNRKLFATANGGTPVEMALPYTVGLWGKTEPVEVELKAGGNVLKFSGPARATFDQFSLTPKN